MNDSVATKTVSKPTFCLTRGFANEAASIVVFGLSALQLSGDLESSNLTQAVRAIAQSYLAQSLLNYLMLAWQATIIAVIGVTGFLFVRFLISFTVFDNYSRSCKRWLTPLTKFGLVTEAILRLALLIYLGLALANFVDSFSATMLLDVLKLFPSAGLDQPLIYGGLLSDSSATFLRTENVWAEVRDLIGAVGVILDVLILSIIWDLVVILARKRVSGNRPVKDWFARFLGQHVLAAFVMIVFCLSIYTVFHSFQTFVFSVILTIVMAIIFVMFTIYTSREVLADWILLVLAKIESYRTVPDCRNCASPQS